MSRPTYNSKRAFSLSPFTMDLPDQRIVRLKKERGAVRYGPESLPELPYVAIDDPEKITQSVLDGAQTKFFQMIEKIFTALVESNLPFESQWPAPLRALYVESQTTGNLDAFFLRGDAQQPPMVLPAIGITVEMEKVPVFMEWLYNEDHSVRVMLDPGRSQFFIFHFRYEKDNDGRCYMGAATGDLLCFCNFSMDDLSTASRLKTILAAFTPVTRDEDGELTEDYQKLHTSFTQWSLCH